MWPMDLRWVDTHTHLDRYEPAERTAILERARHAGVAVVTVGVDADSSRDALGIEGVAGVAAGVHPLHTAEFELRTLLGLLAHPAVMAIGECGFDAEGPPFEVQAAAFTAQANAARALSLALVLHIAGAGAFQRLTRHKATFNGITVIRHYFTGDAAQAAWHADRGHYLSFGNPLRRNPNLRAIASEYPPHLLLIETDTYPLPNRTTEPADLPQIAETLAALRGWPLDNASDQLLANTRAAFPRLNLT